MFETISIVGVRLRQQRTTQTPTTLECLLPLLAVSNDASPLGWSQIWSHLLPNPANHSRISTSEAVPSLPWAQGVGSSNLPAPTTFRLPLCIPFAGSSREPGRLRARPPLDRRTARRRTDEAKAVTRQLPARVPVSRLAEQTTFPRGVNRVPHDRRVQVAPAREIRDRMPAVRLQPRDVGAGELRIELI